ncbi:MAG TPA: APC family permease [Planctomycetota bacterium]|nr:APC family permease [Planctomycetota bacterium]
MADENTGSGKKTTLGLTGLTINAMALIAPGAFLWLTFAMQSQYGAPLAGQGMWFGIVVALALCFATAVAYAELSKLYPGAGSSYFFAEQAFLSKTKYAKFARVAKFTVGWASHLYYWVYPGVMVGVTALLGGYLAGQLWPDTFSSGVASPLFMIIFCVLFAFGVAYIAYRGVIGTTGVNMAINVIQITALLIFSFIAIAYRAKHPEGSSGYTMDPDGNVTDKIIVMETTKEKDGKETTAPKKVKVKNDKGGEDEVYATEKEASGKDKPFLVSYAEPVSKEKDGKETFNYHATGSSVVQPHGFSFIIIQACIAILILVGFESVTSMGEEAKNAKRDIPRAVLLSLGIQGLVCYLIEYFAANFFLNSGYNLTQAGASTAPLGDMMKIVGTWLFGSPEAGWWFMFVQALSVFLALVGTTLSCLSTGARVTYAMGRDEEVPAHFGMLHGKTLTPHRSIWTLAVISAIIGILSILLNYCGSAAATDAAIGDLPKNIWYKFGLFSNATASNLPCSLLVTTLVSNFGTFLLYMMTCLTAIMAFREHQSFSGIKHMVIPVFGLLANLLCMAFYLIGPFLVTGMSPKESFWALGICLAWGVYGAVYFVRSSRAKGKAILLNHAAGSTS